MTHCSGGNRTGTDNLNSLHSRRSQQIPQTMSVLSLEYDEGCIIVTWVGLFSEACQTSSGCSRALAPRSARRSARSLDLGLTGCPFPKNSSRRSCQGLRTAGVSHVPRSARVALCKYELWARTLTSRMVCSADFLKQLKIIYHFQ